MYPGAGSAAPDLKHASVVDATVVRASDAASKPLAALPALKGAHMRPSEHCMMHAAGLRAVARSFAMLMRRVVRVSESVDRVPSS